ncbi:heme peroxidase family protein [Paracoccus sp. TK19116]|uniref:Heme peroxidase family protein n=1 Tax=Paracoccus albicereus TaxID=2922394 RepID=A0ABT1MN36_9RHOB|nr:heme peroxidase family protein [Paracoccus albicereus]MCQ0969690.1 heme peroxidase family protein [Paracoccus albicereus]
MSIVTQSHGGDAGAPNARALEHVRALESTPADGDIAADERADFGYLFPPSGDPNNYLSSDVLGQLDELAELMVPAPGDGGPTVTPDSTLPAVLTYWGQFLDHELTARTDRDSVVSNITAAAPGSSHADIEAMLKNARTPRFDLDSVYGGRALGSGMTPQQARDTATVISGMRHPTLKNKMRVGTAQPDGPMPDGLDPHRDLPRFGQVSAKVREAFLRLVPADKKAKFEATLKKRALIGDMRNDENLIVAQFHLSFLRFHNRVIDFLEANDTGWIADFDAAKRLTTLHYQWLIVEGFLKSICDPAVVQRVIDNRAEHFFAFRRAYAERNGARGLGNALPLEFSVAAYRYGHTMVRNNYDYNANFGRPGNILNQASFELLFRFTGGGDIFGNDRLPDNWIIDWSRFVTADGNHADGLAARAARKIDTHIAPPLETMVNEGNEEGLSDQIRAMLKSLPKRNLRRGFNLRLPTGQALHAHLRSIGAVQSQPIADVGAILDNRPDVTAFLQGSSARLHERTPLWFYVLAEAEAAGGNRLGELGSWIVASTFIGVLLDDPESALSIGFEPTQSPLRLPGDAPIDTIERWMRFALVLE